jgi:tetratricopeptide (TPR) repeat protein
MVLIYLSSMYCSLYLAALMLTTPILRQKIMPVDTVQISQTAKSAVEVGRIAKAITVEIRVIGSKSTGSGILLQQEEGIYTVLTAGHVAEKGTNFTIKTTDEKEHKSIDGSVRLTGKNIDLGTLKFRSSNKYLLAKIGTSNTLEAGALIYVAGFPEKTYAIDAGVFNFTDGKVIGNATKGNDNGYSLIYSNITRPGMSGGPVLSESGELVAIHGQGDRDGQAGDGDKTGRNLGIVVERFGQVATVLNIVLDQQIAALPLTKDLNASDYLLAGNDKSKGGNYEGALIDYNQAIALSPQDYTAYNNRGLLKYSKLNDAQGGLIDLDRAIALDPKSAYAYKNRGALKFQKLNDVQGALADLNRALTLDPKLNRAYVSRGIIKYQRLDDVPGALFDLNKAIKISIISPEASTHIGIIKYQKLNDFQGALKDLNLAILFSPRSAEAYQHRGILNVTKLNNQLGGIKDLRQAVRLFRALKQPKEAQELIEQLKKIGATE